MANFEENDVVCGWNKYRRTTLFQRDTQRQFLWQCVKMADNFFETVGKYGCYWAGNNASNEEGQCRSNALVSIGFGGQALKLLVVACHSYCSLYLDIDGWN